MKLTALVLTGAMAVGGLSLIQAQQAQQPPGFPELPKPPAPPPPACVEEAQRLCAGKQGPEAAECLKSNAEKLSAKCNAGTSK